MSYPNRIFLVYFPWLWREGTRWTGVDSTEQNSFPNYGHFHNELKHIAQMMCRKPRRIWILMFAKNLLYYITGWGMTMLIGCVKMRNEWGLGLDLLRVVIWIWSFRKFLCWQEDFSNAFCWLVGFTFF